jgi:hypothetical protein
MPAGSKPRGSDLSPEQRARIEAIRTKNRTPEARAREAAIRAEYAEKPGIDELIRLGKVDPDRITKLGPLGALLKATASVRKPREATGQRVTQSSGIITRTRRVENSRGDSRG